MASVAFRVITLKKKRGTLDIPVPSDFIFVSPSFYQTESPVKKDELLKVCAFFFV